MPAPPITVAGLFAEWRVRPPGRLSLETYRSLGKAANENGEALLAFDVSREGLENFAGDKILRQVMALALARMGSTELARDLLIQIRDEGHGDEESLGLLSRTYKDLWLRSGSTQDLKAAFNEYLKAYNQSPDRYWTGVNAATLAFALKNAEVSRNLAEQVLRSCEDLRAAQPEKQDYWLIATLAEAELLLDRIPEAERHYAEARKIGNPIANILSTWRNARIILRLMTPSVRAGIQSAFRPPKVAVFEGVWAGDLNQLARHLVASGVEVAYSSAAAGAEIEFLEAIQSLGGQTHVVLPFNEEQFVSEKVAGAGAEWQDRYRQVRDAAQEVIVCSDQKLKFENIGNEYAWDVMHGLAKIRASQLETELAPIGAPKPCGIPPPRVPGFRTERRAMIFADAFHFSHLSEEQIPAFVTEVMDQVGQLCRRAEPKPEYQNTWGDGLFFVFESVVDAGRFALLLSSTIARIDRQSAGLPEQLGLRIGLHAGPVYKFPDQVTDKENYIGWHVNRAARIEPVTPAGKIYASDAFAALAALEAPRQFQFDYVGRIPLAKDFGEFPMYELRAGDR